MSRNEDISRDVYRSGIDLEQVSSLEIGLDICGPQGRNETECGGEGDDGGPKGGEESWDWWDGIEGRPEDEPQGDWDQDS